MFYLRDVSVYSGKCCHLTTDLCHISSLTFTPRFGVYPATRALAKFILAVQIDQHDPDAI